MTRVYLFLAVGLCCSATHKEDKRLTSLDLEAGTVYKMLKKSKMLYWYQAWRLCHFKGKY